MVSKGKLVSLIADIRGGQKKNANIELDTDLDEVTGWAPNPSSSPDYNRVHMPAALAHEIAARANRIKDRVNVWHKALKKHGGKIDGAELARITRELENIHMAFSKVAKAVHTMKVPL